jgi:hypothetical protein
LRSEGDVEKFDAFEYYTPSLVENLPKGLGGRRYLDVTFEMDVSGAALVVTVRSNSKRLAAKKIALNGH